MYRCYVREEQDRRLWTFSVHLLESEHARIEKAVEVMRKFWRTHPAFSTGCGCIWRSEHVRLEIGVAREEAREGTLMRLGGGLRPSDEFSLSVFGLSPVNALEEVGVNVQGHSGIDSGK